MTLYTASYGDVLSVWDGGDPHWKNFVQDISSGRIDTAPEYAELRALPDWAAFRASFDADTGKPEAAGAGKPKAADAGKPKAKGGKR